MFHLINPSTQQNCKGLLTVTLLSAEKLIAADFGGTSDPYAKLVVGNTLLKSEVVQKDTSPKWNQTFEFISKIPTETLDVTLMDYDWGGEKMHDKLGHCSVPIQQVLDAGNKLDLTLPLQDVKSGTVSLRLAWQSFQY